MKINWHVESRKLKDLKPQAKNPRRLSKEAAKHLRASINNYGLCEPIIINTDNMIIGGHQRVKTLKTMKETSADVYVPDRELSQHEVDELTIRLNKNTGEWDFDMLANGYDVGDLLEWGFTLDELQLDAETVETEEPEDEAPEPPKDPRTKPGDVYQLGDHILICGDCTNAKDVQNLIGADTIDMLCTDPPYGVDYSSKNEMLNKKEKGYRNQTPIENDNISDYRKFFVEFLSLIPWCEKNTSYIFMSGQELHNVRLAMQDCGMKWGDYLIWVKNNHVLGRKDYNAKHEFIVYGWKGTHEFFGPSNSVTTIEWDRPSSSKEHPTMKPVGLVQKLINDGSKKNDIVYDPFAGSGTTLLACEAEQRKARCVELSPHYCDVIVERWVNHRKNNNKDYVVTINAQEIEW